jgi:hypothetical protein
MYEIKSQFVLEQIIIFIYLAKKIDAVSDKKY